MRVHLGGHLNWYDPQRRADLTVAVPRRVRLLDVLAQLGVPRAEIMVAAINGQLASLEEAWVEEGDRLDLYPPVGGG